MAVGDAIMALSPHSRQRLTAALDASHLPPAPTGTAIAATVGLEGGVDDLIADLNALEKLGVVGTAAAAWVRAVEQANARTVKPDLVWSGQEVPGVAARQTASVFDEVIRTAERTLWVSTYAFFDGPQVFAALAERLDRLPDLKVTLLLNIQRHHSDTTTADQLVRRFADRFWTDDWPGDRRPDVYYDPRAVEARGSGGVLHAKAVVADSRTLFVTSANLTDAALHRNIELGVLLRDRTLAMTAESQFRGLIEHKWLAPL